MSRHTYVVVARNQGADQLPTDAKEVYRGTQKQAALKAMDRALVDFAPPEWWVGISIEPAPENTPTLTFVRAQIRSVRDGLRQVEAVLSDPQKAKESAVDLSATVGALVDLIDERAGGAGAPA